MAGRDTRTVAIDCFPESLRRYGRVHVAVAVDVIRATTTALSVVLSGRRCFPVASLDDVERASAALENPLLAGEVGGDMPEGFHLQNSPVEIEARTDVHRPVVLLSTAGTRLVCETSAFAAGHAACLRNIDAQVAHLSDQDSSVVVVGAGAREEFREEDEMCCAWIARGLIAAGFEPTGRTEEVVARWDGASVDIIRHGGSADYLRRSGQEKDLEFILARVNDVDAVLTLRDGELVLAT